MALSIPLWIANLICLESWLNPFREHQIIGRIEETPVLDLLVFTGVLVFIPLGLVILLSSIIKKIRLKLEFYLFAIMAMITTIYLIFGGYLESTIN